MQFLLFIRTERWLYLSSALYLFGLPLSTRTVLFSITNEHQHSLTYINGNAHWITRANIESAFWANTCNARVPNAALIKKFLTYDYIRGKFSGKSFSIFDWLSRAHFLIENNRKCDAPHRSHCGILKCLCARVMK